MMTTEQIATAVKAGEIDARRLIIGYRHSVRGYAVAVWYKSELLYEFWAGNVPPEGKPEAAMMGDPRVPARTLCSWARKTATRIKHEIGAKCTPFYDTDIPSTLKHFQQRGIEVIL